MTSLTHGKRPIATSRVDITNILRAAFARADPNSAKNRVKLSVSFALLGSDLVKALCKMLVKLTPVVNLILPTFYEQLLRL